jgi:glutaminase
MEVIALETELDLSRWLEECRAFCAEGMTADYIPALAKADPRALGIAVHALGHEPVSAGNSGNLFTLQSVSKVFTLLLALMDHGEEGVFERVGMEPTGDDFKSMLKLELVSGKPFNPLINAGAITITSMISGASRAEKWNRIREFIASLAGVEEIGFNEEVYLSEKETNYRNRSLAYFLKDSGVLDGDVEEHLDLYFMHCAMEMNCAQLARAALVLANGGKEPDESGGRQLVPRRYVQIATTFMLTCGMYNSSGEFAVKAGIPAKSGVSGAIMAVVPNRMGIGVIGPALNDKGNSVGGIRLLEKLSREWNLSMF